MSIIGNVIAINYTKTDKDDYVHFLTHVPLNLPRDTDVSTIISQTAQKICTSSYNIQLLEKYFGYQGCNLVPLDPRHTYSGNVGDEYFTVKAIKSYYNTGSVMLLFRGLFGTILYTGFLGQNPNMMKLNIMNSIRNRTVRVDRLYLDATYLELEAPFSTTTQVIALICQFFKASPKKLYYLHVAPYGMEDVLAYIAESINETFVVDPDFLATLKDLGYDKHFTTNVTRGRIQVITKMIFNKRDRGRTRRNLVYLRNVDNYCHKFQAYCKHKVSNNIVSHQFTIYGHCNYYELEEWLKAVDPVQTVPLYLGNGKSASFTLDEPEMLLDMSPAKKEKFRLEKDEEYNLNELETTDDYKEEDSTKEVSGSYKRLKSTNAYSSIKKMRKNLLSVDTNPFQDLQTDSSPEKKISSNKWDHNYLKHKPVDIVFSKIKNIKPGEPRGANNIINSTSSVFHETGSANSCLKQLLTKQNSQTVKTDNSENSDFSSDVSVGINEMKEILIKEEPVELDENELNSPIIYCLDKKYQKTNDPSVIYSNKQNIDQELTFNEQNVRHGLHHSQINDCLGVKSSICEDHIPYSIDENINTDMYGVCNVGTSFKSKIIISESKEDIKNVEPVIPRLKNQSEEARKNQIASTLEVSTIRNLKLPIKDMLPTDIENLQPTVVDIESLKTQRPILDQISTQNNTERTNSKIPNHDFVEVRELQSESFDLSENVMVNSESKDVTASDEDVEDIIVPILPSMLLTKAPNTNNNVCSLAGEMSDPSSTPSKEIINYAISSTSPPTTKIDDLSAPLSFETEYPIHPINPSKSSDGVFTNDNDEHPIQPKKSLCASTAPPSNDIHLLRTVPSPEILLKPTIDNQPKTSGSTSPLTDLHFTPEECPRNPCTRTGSQPLVTPLIHLKPIKPTLPKVTVRPLNVTPEIANSIHLTNDQHQENANKMFGDKGSTKRPKLSAFLEKHFSDTRVTYEKVNPQKRHVDYHSYTHKTKFETVRINVTQKSPTKNNSTILLNSSNESGYKGLDTFRLNYDGLKKYPSSKEKLRQGLKVPCQTNNYSNISKHNKVTTSDNQFCLVQLPQKGFPTERKFVIKQIHKKISDSNFLINDECIINEANAINQSNISSLKESIVSTSELKSPIHKLQDNIHSSSLERVEEFDDFVSRLSTDHDYKVFQRRVLSGAAEEVLSDESDNSDITSQFIISDVVCTDSELSSESSTCMSSDSEESNYNLLPTVEDSDIIEEFEGSSVDTSRKNSSRNPKINRLQTARKRTYSMSQHLPPKALSEAHCTVKSSVSNLPTLTSNCYVKLDVNNIVTHGNLLNDPNQKPLNTNKDDKIDTHDIEYSDISGSISTLEVPTDNLKATNTTRFETNSSNNKSMTDVTNWSSEMKLANDISNFTTASENELNGSAIESSEQESCGYDKIKAPHKESSESSSCNDNSLYNSLTISTYKTKETINTPMNNSLDGTTSAATHKSLDNYSPETSIASSEVKVNTKNKLSSTMAHNLKNSPSISSSEIPITERSITSSEVEPNIKNKEVNNMTLNKILNNSLAISSSEKFTSETSMNSSEVEGNSENNLANMPINNNFENSIAVSSSETSTLETSVTSSEVEGNNKNKFKCDKAHYTNCENSVGSSETSTLETSISSTDVEVDTKNKLENNIAYDTNFENSITHTSSSETSTLETSITSSDGELNTKNKLTNIMAHNTNFENSITVSSSEISTSDTSINSFEVISEKNKVNHVLWPNSSVASSLEKSISETSIDSSELEVYTGIKLASTVSLHERFEDSSAVSSPEKSTSETSSISSELELSAQYKFARGNMKLRSSSASYKTKSWKHLLKRNKSQRTSITNFPTDSSLELCPVQSIAKGNEQKILESEDNILLTDSDLSNKEHSEIDSFTVENVLSLLPIKNSGLIGPDTEKLNISETDTVSPVLNKGQIRPLNLCDEPGRSPDKSKSPRKSKILPKFKNKSNKESKVLSKPSSNNHQDILKEFCRSPPHPPEQLSRNVVETKTKAPQKLSHNQQKVNQSKRTKRKKKKCLANDTVFASRISIRLSRLNKLQKR